MNGGTSQWFVFVDGGDHVGPVALDLLARGIVAGKVPRDAQVACGEAKDWRAVLEFPELVAAMDSARSRDPNALAPLVPDAPGTDTDMTEVMKRDDDLAAAFDDITRKKKPSAAPKPPPASRSGGPPSVGPQSVSRASSAAVAPLAPRVPSIPPEPIRPTAPSVPPPPDAPSAALAPPPARATSPSVPPRTPSVPPFPIAPPPTGAPPVMVPSVPPPPVALIPSAPPPMNASVIAAPVTSPMPLTASAPPPGTSPKKDEPKKPALDPRLMMLLPLGIFGVFAFLSLLVVIYALVTKSYQ
ncbi:MAG TPA: GYF domain-containing protein [Labilithrix sp.]|jgi:hypothetical protein